MYAQEMARLDALLAEEQHKEAAALAPLLRRKERVWAAINGCVFCLRLV